MTRMDVIILLGAVARSTGLLRFFFASPDASRATLRGGVQEVTLTIEGGYAPDRIEMQQGVPLRLAFDWQEAGDCMSRVVFSDFGINALLPAHVRTTIEMTPDRHGEFGPAGAGRAALDDGRHPGGRTTGILIRSAEALETAQRLDAIILGKTGALTQGAPAAAPVQPDVEVGGGAGDSDAARAAMATDPEAHVPITMRS